MDAITGRIAAIADEMKELQDAALEAEETGYELSQDELRVLFENLKRLNSELGRAQFDMMNSPVWEYMEEDDRQEFLGFINQTIAGWNMIKEAMDESPEGVN